VGDIISERLRHPHLFRTRVFREWEVIDWMSQLQFSSSKSSKEEHTELTRFTKWSSRSTWQRCSLLRSQEPELNPCWLARPGVQYFMARRSHPAATLLPNSGAPFRTICSRNESNCAMLQRRISVTAKSSKWAVGECGLPSSAVPAVGGDVAVRRAAPAAGAGMRSWGKRSTQRRAVLGRPNCWGWIFYFTIRAHNFFYGHL
jgi:hypothetical protein